MEYKTVLEIKEALQSGELNPDELGTFNCKQELFINDKKGKRLFSAYYGTNNGCNDVCTLLGLPEPELV